MGTSRATCRVATVAMLCAVRLAGAAPWQLYPVQVDQPVAIEAAFAGVQVTEATLRTGDDGPVASVKLSMAGNVDPVGLCVIGFDAARRPLAAGYEQIAMPRLVGRRSTLTAAFELTTAFGWLPEGESIAYVAVGPMTRLVHNGNLLSLGAGARVVAQSSSYGGSFEPDRVLDDNPRTQWATATGQVREAWLVVELAGGGSQRISGIGINPWGEASYTDCALQHFTLQVSTTGTAPEDFTTVIADACAYADQLQHFEFEPVEARYLKLLCHDNHGNDRWIEVSSFEAYPAELPETPSAGLAALLEATAAMLRTTGDPPEARLGVEDPMILDFYLVEPSKRSPTLPPPVLELVGCQQAAAAWRSEVSEERELRFLNLSYDFGMLLGGARQLCAAVVGDLPMGRPVRLQFDARLEPPASRLRVVVWDRQDAWFEYAVAHEGQGWQRYWVDLDQPASKRSGAEAPAYPLGRLAIGAAPRGRDGTAGSLDIDDPLLLYPPAE